MEYNDQTMSNIILPYNFKPRDYQWETFNARFNEGYRNFVDIEHRRAGKDTKWLNIMIAEIHRRVGVYLYLLPTRKHAKKVIWDNINGEGNSFLSCIPPGLIDGMPNKTDLMIRFKNGSILQLGGSDYYDSWMGTNPVGIIFSEYSIQDPAGAAYFTPILVENGGWQAYCYTPRGRNHGYYLYANNVDNPKWFCQLLTINDTKKNDGSPVIKKEDIETLRSTMSEELIQQEFYCSFDAATEGAYFAKAIRKLREEGRINDFRIDTNFAASTYWDLGVNDKTAFWIIQYVASTDEYKVIYYYENQNQDFQHYINKLYEIRDKLGLVYKAHYGPHDIVKRQANNNRSLMWTAMQLGIQFQKVDRIPHKQDGIEAVRAILPKCHFHETNCQVGLGALSSYHAISDSKRGTIGQPEHDWASDGADAFMQFAQVSETAMTKNGQIIMNAVNTTCPIIGI